MAKFLDPFYQEDAPSKDLGYFAEQADAAKGFGPLHDKVAKRVAAMTSIMENGDIAGQYETIKRSLEETGQDDVVDKWKAFSEMDLNEDDVATVDVIMRDPTLSQQDKVNMMFEVQKKAEERKPRSTAAIYDNEMMMRGATQTGQEDRVHQAFFKDEEAISKSNSDIEALLNEYGAKFDSSTGQALADFTVSALVPGFGIKLKQILDDVLPEEGPALNNVAVGDQIKLFKQAFKNAEPADREAMARKLLTAMDDMAASWYVNDYEKYDYINTLLGELNPTDSSIEVDRWINNAFGVVDLLPALGGVSHFLYKTWKTISRAAPIGRAMSTAPKNAAEMMVEALEDQRKAELMDTDAEEIVSSAVFPKPLDEARRAGPDLNERINVKTYLDTDPYAHGVNYTPVEKALAQERTTDRIAQINDADAKQILSQSDVMEIPGGYKVDFTVGHSSDYGFESIDAARDAVEDFLEVQSGAKLSFLKKDVNTGNWVKASVDDVSSSEYLAQVEVQHIYNTEDVVAESLNDAVVGVGGPVAKYLDKSSVFSRWVAEAGNVAADKNSFIRTRLEEHLRPLIKLPAKKQANVFRVLDEGDVEGTWFPRDVLNEKFEGDESMIQAYYAVKDHQDALYELQNYRLRSKLDAAGYRELRNEETGFVNIARPADRGDIEADVSRMYDADTGSLVDVNPEILDELYAQGGRVLRLKSKEYFEDEAFDLVMVGQDSRTGLTELPTHVLNYRPGYISRVYDTTHVVKVKKTGVKINGKPVKADPGVAFNGRALKDGEVLSAVKMAPSRGQAIREAKNLARANTDEGLEYGVVEANELRDIEYAHRQDYEFFRDRGQLYFSPRGEEIESISGARTLRSIPDSLEQARRNVAKHISMDDFLDSMTRRWEKKYGSLFGVGKDRRMPLTGPLAETSDPTLRGERAAAVALRDHIAMVAGIDPSHYRRNWRNLLIAMADRISGTAESRFALPLREELAQSLLKASKGRGPIELAKAAAFTRFIALNPARQILLQSQQATVYLGIEHGFRYFAGGRGIRDYLGLTMGLSLRDNPKLWRQMSPTVAKGMGMSTKEYTEFVDAFRRSGLRESIDSHPFSEALALGSRSVAADSAFMQSINRAGEGVKGGIRLARKLGFDFGEYNNISTAWLAARNKWIKNNPGKLWSEADNLDAIAGEARAISFNMNPAGALAFQKGTMGLVFQFMSHATKSAQVLIPERALGQTIGKLSNKAFSGKERFRIAMMQLGLYGIGGFGLYGAWEKFRDESGIDVDAANKEISKVVGSPVDLNEVLREGITGEIVNAAFQAADAEGTQSEIAFSESFGPFSGVVTQTPVSTMMKYMIDGVLINPLDAASIRQFGAGLSLPVEFMRAMGAAKFIAGVDSPEVDTEDKILATVQNFSRLLTGYNNYVKGQAALKSGQFFSTSGSPTVRAAAGEALGQMVFGLRGYREKSVQGMLDSARQFTQVSSEGLDTALQETANTLYNNTLKLARQLNNGQVTHQQMVDISANERNALRLSLGEENFFRVMHHFQNRVFSDLNQNNESKLADMLTKYYARGVIPLQSATSNRVKNMPDFVGKEEILKWINTMLESKARGEI